MSNQDTSYLEKGLWWTELAVVQGAGAVAELGVTAEIEKEELPRSRPQKINVSSVKNLVTGTIKSNTRSNECSKGDGTGVRSGKCFICGKRGHLAKGCTKAEKREGSQSKSRRKSKSSKTGNYGRKQK